MAKKELKTQDNKWLLEPKVLIVLAVFVLLAIGLAWGMTAQSCCPKKASLAAVEPQLNSSPSIEVPNQSSVITVEVYHFHRTTQCGSCIQLGKLAEKTVNTYFADELLSGALVFGHINYELPENQVLSDKFGPSGASLWIGTTVSGEFHNEEDTKVWYKLWDEEDFMTYLKEVLDKRLAGDLS